ncbi:hypothetical protein KXJ81_04295 [Ensifer adhaerens]|uniref:hypothetical protein n=1 Tax=Ensifer adhaerens TaxID=106592 RepID=UPI0013AFCD12|nr:hypothetical protein [Ensifer adhaerens]MBW0365461.1 hypothetical protein [Ensifer adhaerens]
MSNIKQETIDLFAFEDDALRSYLRQHSGTALEIPFWYLNYVRLHGDPKIALGSRPIVEHDVRLAYGQVLQRRPESQDMIASQIAGHATANALAISLLEGTEWRLRVAQLCSNAFPNRRRLWHVHIPKTAGTSFWLAAEESGSDHLNTNWLGDATDVVTMAKAVRLSPSDNVIVVSGHAPLAQWFDAIGSSDRALTFVREPVEVVISLFNYACDMYHERDTVHSGSVDEFLSLGFDPTSFEASYDSEYIPRNLQCSFLAPDATCRSALELAASANCEILPVQLVDDVIVREFERAQPRANISSGAVRRENVPQKLLERIYYENAQDYALYAVATERARSADWMRSAAARFPNDPVQSADASPLTPRRGLRSDQ